MIHQSVSRRRLVALLAGGICALPLVGCDAGSQGLPLYRYRVTVEVETPEGVRAGSSVIEVRTSVASRYSIPTPRVISRSVRGEAITVDLGPRRGKIFALLQSDDDVDWASNIFYKLSQKNNNNNKISQKQSFTEKFNNMLRNEAPIDVPKKYPKWPYAGNGSTIPIFVTFKDMGDPKSIIKIDPDHLDRYLGKGVSLKRIFIQLTQDPVSSGIYATLPWLRDFPDRIDLSDFQPAGIPVGDFQRLFKRSY